MYVPFPLPSRHPSFSETDTDRLLPSAPDTFDGDFDALVPPNDPGHSAGATLLDSDESHNLDHFFDNASSLMNNLAGDLDYATSLWAVDPPPHLHGYRTVDLDAQQVFTEQEMLQIHENYMRAGQGSITAGMPPEIMDAALALMSPMPQQGSYSQGVQHVQQSRPRQQIQRTPAQRSNSMTVGYSQQQSPSTLSPHAQDFAPQAFYRPQSASFSGPSSVPMAPPTQQQQQQQQPHSAGPVRNGSLPSSNPHEVFGMRIQSHMGNRAHLPTSFNFGSDMNFNASGYMPPSNRETENQVTERIINTITALQPESAGSTQPSSPALNRHMMDAHIYASLNMPEPVPVTSQPKQEPITPNGFGFQSARPGKRKRTVSDDQDEDGARRHSTGSSAPQEDGSSSASARPRSAKLRKTSHSNETAAAAAASSASRRRHTSTGGTKPFRVNLTEEEKRNNHILSEQKRRNLIKNGFEELNGLVPELQVGGMSKSNILLEVAAFIQNLIDGNKALCSILGEDFDTRERAHMDAVEADKLTANAASGVNV